MTPEELYEMWAPADSIWSAWAKPVLFAQFHSGKRKNLGGVAPGEDVVFEPDEAFSWVRAYRHDTALIVNLPGYTSVGAALHLANEGFRPVPLFNCSTSEDAPPVVSVARILSELLRGAVLISSFNLAPDSPPVFLLDSERNPPRNPRPGQFDNRWVIFPQDFPSATYFMAHGIRRIVIIQPKHLPGLQGELQPDLYTVVQRWHSAGLETVLHQVEVTDPDPDDVGSPLWDTAIARPLTFGRLSRLRMGAFGVAATLMAFAARRSAGGGFGRIIPDPSSSGGG